MSSGLNMDYRVKRIYIMMLTKLYIKKPAELFTPAVECELETISRSKQHTHRGIKMDPHVKNIYYNFLCLPKNPKSRKVRILDKWFVDMQQMWLNEHEDLLRIQRADKHE